MSGTSAAWSGPTEPGTVASMRRAVVEFAAGAGFRAGALEDVRSCVSESVTNAVVHAFPDEGTSGTVEVSAEVRGDELLVRVMDDGVGFGPRTDSPGLGLGLPMIQALTTCTSVSIRPRGGTELCMRFAVPRVVETQEAIAPGAPGF